MASVEPETNLMEGNDEKIHLLQEYDWLDTYPEDPNQVLCKMCHEKITAHMGDIERHQKTKRHSEQVSKDILAGEEGSSEDGVSSANKAQPREVDSAAENVSQHVDCDSSNRMLCLGESAPTRNTTTAQTNTAAEYRQRCLKYLGKGHQAAVIKRPKPLKFDQEQLKSEAAAINETELTFLRQQHEYKLDCQAAVHEAKMEAFADVLENEIALSEQQALYERKENEKIMQLFAKMRAASNPDIKRGPKKGET